MTVESTENTEAIADALSDPTPVETSEIDELGAAYDRIVTQNGADRGGDGKFTSSKESPDGSGDLPEGEGAGEGDSSSTVLDATPAPANWTGLDDAWKAIPAEQREKVKTHFDDLHRRMSDQGRQLAQSKPLADKLIQGVSQLPQFRGFSPEQIAEGAIRLANVQASLESGPASALDTILQIAQAYKVLPDLTKRLTGAEMPEGQNETHELKREIAELKNQLRSGPQQIEAHVSRAIEGRAALDTVVQFAKDPANSFFGVVEPHIPAFMERARQDRPELAGKELLQAAYESALKEFGLKDMKEAAAKAAAPVVDQKRTEAAKKAASINVKSSSTGKERPLGEIDALSAAYDRAMAG